MSKLALLVLVALVAAAASARFAPEPVQVSRAGFERWMCYPGAATCVDMDRDSVPAIAAKLVKRVEHALTDLPALAELFQGNEQVAAAIRVAQVVFKGRTPTLAEVRDAIRTMAPSKPAANASYPFFAWIPMPVTTGGLVPGAPAFTFSTPCFGSVTAHAVMSGPTTVTATFTTANQLQLICGDAYLMSGAGATALQEFDSVGVHTVTFNVSDIATSAAEKWYLESTGIHVLRFQSGLLETVGQLIDTIVLMTGFAQMPLNPNTFADNLQFLQTYIQASARMGPVSQMRTSGDAVARGINPDYIQSGDALLILRPDGLDPMIGWGEGANVGHSTIAVRFGPENALHVCESTTTDAYWPTNGIQCHPWAEWLNLTMAAQFNMVLVPLAPAFQKAFNTTKAMQFFAQHEGIDYGFATFLFGWLDLATENFPCVPPTYTTCLGTQSAELIAMLLDKVFENNHENFFRQALAHRVGVWPTQIPVVNSLMRAATVLNVTFTQLYTMVEQDSWMYNTTRNGIAASGKSMVCCVFVCNMWKAAGVFGELADEIQCGEQTLWDIFSMQIFDSAKMGAGRPAVCKQYDPTNPLCQMMGNFTLHLVPDVNTRPLYAHMGEKCGSKGPTYIREPGC